MKKIISFTDIAKELFVVLMSPKKDTASTLSHPASNDILAEPRHSTRKSIQKFKKWKEEFFTLDGFDNYNDVYPD